MISARISTRAVALFLFAAVCLVRPEGASAQRRLVRVAVTPPAVSGNEYQPMGKVWAGVTKRELNRMGGIELVPEKDINNWVDKNNGGERISDRRTAFDMGEELNADVVIFTSLARRHQFIAYAMTFLEVQKDVVQRTMTGNFEAVISPSGVGRIVNEQMLSLVRYLPRPSELDDPAEAIRDNSIDPSKLPSTTIIEGIPPIDRFLYVEQLFSYFRVFPGEAEYTKFEQQKIMTRLVKRQDMDEELSSILQGLYITGDFALRHGLQAYMIQDCSLGAINVLLANGIPVFFSKGIITGYSNLEADGYCLYHTIDKLMFESIGVSHRDRVTVMIILPRPGRKYGLSKTYLDTAVAYYLDELGKTPRLVEVKDSMFDIISGGLD